MATTPLAISSVTGTAENTTRLYAGSDKSTGDLRRRFDFSDRFTELAVNQTPFFRLVSQIAKSPTDDPAFKYAEKRQSWHKRHGYVIAQTTAEGTPDNYGEGGSDATCTTAVDNTHYFWVASDMQYQGNIQNIVGQYDIDVGAAKTRPQHYLPKQMIRIPSRAAGGTNFTTSDYFVGQIQAVVEGLLNTHTSTVDSIAAGAFSAVSTDSTNAHLKECVRLKVYLVRVPSSDKDLSCYTTNAPTFALSAVGESVSGAKDTGATALAPLQTHTIGSSYEEGSSLVGSTWKDEPYSTSYGQTQIFRDEFGMTNTSRATVLKFEPNEWARVWKDKLVEHKWNMELAGLFGVQGSASVATGSEAAATHYYTQGAADFCLRAGNIFQLALATKTTDDFLEDMSKFLDPRYNNANATVFFCDTATYNWLLKLGSAAHNALFSNVVNATSDGASAASNHRYDFAVAGKKSLFGVDLTQITTPYGDINVTRNIALDQSNIKILGINMNYVKYRPLVGNGINRDTAIYVGVQTLENSGIDKRVDMILTEAGFEWKMPEAHAVWK